MSFECRNLDTVIPAPTNFTIVRNTESKPLTFLAGIFATLNKDADFAEDKCETKYETQYETTYEEQCETKYELQHSLFALKIIPS